MTPAAKPGIPLEIQPFFEAVAERKGMGLVALDIRGRSSVSDFLVIVSARSTRQAIAMAEHIVDFMAARKKKPLGKEGLETGQWALLDFGDVVVHVFYEVVRSFYDLEGLWADVPRIRPEPSSNEARKDSPDEEDEDGENPEDEDEDGENPEED
ncbi:MAG: ribosome silencing factor [Proteobacteria bacterium]|nr:ribosome silencing factor [Pseudomonadota bacterium]